MVVKFRKIVEEGIKEIYEVNENSEIRNIKTGRILKSYANWKRRGYRQVQLLGKDGKSHSKKIYRLAAKAFPEICGEWFDGCEVDHIDGNIQNNNVHNLRVTDKSGNMMNPLTREKLRKKWTNEMREKYSKMMKENNPIKNMTPEWRKKLADSHRRFKNVNCWVKCKQYTLNGIFVAEYQSQTEASRKTGISLNAISHTLTGRQKSGGGYLWEYS